VEFGSKGLANFIQYNNSHGTSSLVSSPSNPQDSPSPASNRNRHLRSASPIVQGTGVMNSHSAGAIGLGTGAFSLASHARQAL